MTIYDEMRKEIKNRGLACLTRPLAVSDFYEVITAVEKGHKHDYDFLDQALNEGNGTYKP